MSFYSFFCNFKGKFLLDKNLFISTVSLLIQHAFFLYFLMKSLGQSIPVSDTLCLSLSLGCYIDAPVNRIRDCTQRQTLLVLVNRDRHDGNEIQKVCSSHAFFVLDVKKIHVKVPIANQAGDYEYTLFFTSYVSMSNRRPLGKYFLQSL